jgi:acetolactate synthase-1/2/3 large subunit
MDVPLADAGTYSREHTTDVPVEKIEDAAELLADSERPVILAGGGVRASEASDHLRQVASDLNAPVVTTYKGKGVLPDTSDRVAGALSGSASPELLALLDDADALLGVGTDFDAVATRSWSVDVPDALVHVTLSPADLGTGYEPTVGIVADAARSLDALSGALADHSVDGNGVERAQAVREATADRLDPLLGDEPPLTSVRALRAIREALPEETVVSADAGGFRVWGLNTFDAAGPRAYVNPGSWATMGTGLPAGLGAQLANPDENVAVLTGDGGLMMCLHELHTAVAESIPVTVVVFNNSDYAIISEAAGMEFDLPEQAYSWAEAPLSFVTIAEGMGLEAERAETPDEIRDALSTAITSDEPTLLEVPTDPTEPQASTWMSE